MEKFIDLHMHLDGAVTVDIARHLAELQSIYLPEDDGVLKHALTVHEDCRSLTDFLRCFALPLSLMQTYEGLREAAYLVAGSMKEQGIIYGEIRYAPQLHTTRGMTQEDSLLAVREGIQRSGMKANIILCCMRGSDNAPQNMETIALAGNHLTVDGGVVAVDLAGADTVFPTQDYDALFAATRNYEIPLTLHAGEADGAESVRKAMEYGAVRIGHGVRAYEDETVLQRIAERGIVLEMCPTSNRQTRAVEDMTKYPFMDYLRRGIRVTLNTDDPGIEGTTIREEYRLMEREYGLTEEQEKLVLSYAVDGAFTSEAVKAQLRRELGI